MKAKLITNFFFQALDQAGYDGWVVGEYLPKGKTTNGLGWIDRWEISKGPISV